MRFEDVRACSFTIVVSECVLRKLVYDLKTPIVTEMELVTLSIDKKICVLFPRFCSLLFSFPFLQRCLIL